MRLEDYLLVDKLPLFWCAGCGDGSVLQALLRTFEQLGLKKEKTVVVTGIGCWGKADDYISTNTFHGTHGRALAFATGIKLANPKLKVVVLMGDGDGATIGGNHLIHAARRNVDVTAIVVNNLNYGMTGGQYSGTTPTESITTTSQYGHVEKGFDLCKLVEAAGAPFVARGTTYGIVQLEKYILQALQKTGFSFVEAVAQCPTHYSKKNKIGNAGQMLLWMKEHSVTIAQAEKMDEKELQGKFVTGVFRDVEEEDYGSRYQKVISLAKQMKEVK